MKYEIHQLPIDIKIPQGFDKDKFLRKVYNMAIELAEENNIEIISDCLSMYIDEVEE